MESETAQEIGMSKRITDYYSLRESIPNLVAERIGEPEKWLDIGCGMGGSIRKSLERFPEATFTLVDPSEENICVAKDSIGDRPGCEFIQSTSDALRLSDGCFDIITCILSHHYYSDTNLKLEAVRNCRRMLRDGGIFITVEHTRYETSQPEKDAEWVDYMRRMGLGEESINEMLDRRGTFYFPLTEEEHIRLMEKAGFRDIQVFWRTCSDIGLVATKR